jgi:hypothetical protein
VKIDIKYEKALDIANALRARAETFERRRMKGLAPSNWQQKAAEHRLLADGILTHDRRCAPCRAVPLFGSQSV